MTFQFDLSAIDAMNMKYVYIGAGVVVSLYLAGTAVHRWWSYRKRKCRRGRYLSFEEEKTRDRAASNADGGKDSATEDQIEFFYEPPSSDPMARDIPQGVDSAAQLPPGGDKQLDEDAAGEGEPPRSPAALSPAGAALAGPAVKLMGRIAPAMAAAAGGEPTVAMESSILAEQRHLAPKLAMCASAATVYAAGALAPPAAPAAERRRFPDVALARDLAQVSSDAYNAPPDEQGYQTRDIFGLPTLTFYDKELLKQQYDGVLQTKLVRANNLKRIGSSGVPRAYAVLSVGRGSFRSKTFSQTINPAWKETQTLFVGDTDIDALVVRVFHDDFSPNNEDLGLAAMGLSSLVPLKGERKKFVLPLRGPAGDRACVTVKCRLILFKDMDPDQVPDIKPMAKLCREKVPPGEKPGSRTSSVIAVSGRADSAAAAAAGAITATGSSGSTDRSALMTQMEPMAFVDATDTDTQVWVHWNKQQRTVVCAFRGTETNKLKDIITDMRFLPCKFTNVKGKTIDHLRIHTGFMNAYGSVRRTLKDMMANIAAINGKATQPWRVVLTGHSLGAALASLAAFELAMFKSFFNVESVSLYTYGSPRVGNDTFARELDTLVPDTWRVANPYDIVTSIPPAWFSYAHAGRPVRLRPDGEASYGPNLLEYVTQYKQQKKKTQSNQDDATAVNGNRQLPEPPALGLEFASNVRFSTDAVRDVRWYIAALSLKGVAEHACTLYASRLAMVLQRPRPQAPPRLLPQQPQQE